MHENDIVSSPECCVESNEFLFAKKVFCFLFSDDKLFLHQCNLGPLKDVSRSRMLLLSIHLLYKQCFLFLHL